MQLLYPNPQKRARVGVPRRRPAPVAIINPSSGPVGGARKVLLFMNAMVLAKPEIFIGMVNTKFDANRQCTDDSTRNFVSDQMRSFERWIEGVRRMGTL
jgi:chromate reductase, NAD(P)H dehydrogenase (quinone)